MVNYKEYITIETGKRSGKPCIRGLRITVSDILGYLAVGMNFEELLDDFPQLTKNDILAALAFSSKAENARLMGFLAFFIINVNSISSIITAQY